MKNTLTKNLIIVLTLVLYLFSVTIACGCEKDQYPPEPTPIPVPVPPGPTPIPVPFIPTPPLPPLPTPLPTPTPPVPYPPEQEDQDQDQEDQEDQEYQDQGTNGGANYGTHHGISTTARINTKRRMESLVIYIIVYDNPKGKSQLVEGYHNRRKAEQMLIYYKNVNIDRDNYYIDAVICK